MRSRLITGIAAGLLLATNALALEPGDQAPKLEAVNWLKGEPIKEFQEGHVYVLDFWATWCRPCIASIPHLNELQDEHRDDNVHVVGLAIWPSPNSPSPAAFVKERNDDMGYRVGEDVGSATAEAYMAAAGLGGIPAVFVIDKTGTIAWIGHPMDGLDQVLDDVVNDKFNLEARQAAQEKAQQLEAQLGEAYFGSDWSKVVEITTAMLEHDDDKFSAAAVYKYVALAKLGTDEESRKAARTWGAQVTSTLYADDADSLQALAWHIIADDSPLEGDEADTEFAVIVAEKASGLRDNEDVSMLDTLARAYFANAQPRKAVDTQTKALGLLDKEFESYADNPDAITQLNSVKQHLQTKLDEFKEALPTAEAD